MLRDLFGFMSPGFWYSAHAASGTIKRLGTSKTMNVPEVTTLYECLRTVIKHFESSVKNKEILDQYMEILEMTLLHLLSWYQTRMVHFLKSCHVFDGVLAAVFDVMCTKGIPVDERDLLFSVMNVYVLKIMSDLQPKFEGMFLRQADKTDLLVSRVFDMSDSFASSLESLTTPSADAFQDLLHFAQSGNLLGTTKCGANVHTIMLNHPHKPSGHVTEHERLEKVKTEVNAVKRKILTNIIQNVKDQYDIETYYFSWSGLDLQLKLSVPDRITRLKDIMTLYCAEVHTPKR